MLNRVSVPAEHEDQLDPGVLSHLLAPGLPDGCPCEGVPGGGEHGDQDPDLGVGGGAGAGLGLLQGRPLFRPQEGRHVPRGEPGEVWQRGGGPVQSRLEDEVEEEGEDHRHNHDLKHRINNITRRLVVTAVYLEESC